MAIVLVVGTISTIVPASFAQLEYKGYEDTYVKDLYNKNSNTKYSNINDDLYPKDITDSKNVIVNKIKCNNINVIGTNIPSTSNGDMMNGITDEDDETGQQAQWSGNHPHGTSDFNRNVVTICNNVNNIMGLGNEEEEEEGIGILSIMKTISCIIDGADTLQEVCDAITIGNPFLPDLPITPDEFEIEVTGNDPDPSSFEASSTPVEVTIGEGEFVVSEMAYASVQASIDLIKNEQPIILIEGPNVTFSGDCNQQGNSMTAEGSIADGESQTCNIDNAFVVSLTTPG